MRFGLLALAGLLWSAHAVGDGIANIAVNGDTLTAEIALPGDLSADLRLEFEQVIGLTAANVGLSAEIVNPSSPLLRRRFPIGEAISIPQAFPVLLHIDPSALGGLSFAGVAVLTLHTHALPYTATTPLRLFAASNGGPFHDISDGISSGSYRVRGTRGEFSEFLILADLRAIATVIDGKYDRVTATLNDYQASIPASVYSTLSAQLSASRAGWDGDDIVAAIEAIDDLIATVLANSGGNIPDVWRSSRDLNNVAGLLRSHSATLRLSLARASNGLP